MNELPVFQDASNANVCGWFWLLFIINFVGFVIYAIIMFLKFFHMKGVSFFLRVVLYLLVILGMSLAVINGGFMYTMCNRALA